MGLTNYKREPCYDTRCFYADEPSAFNDGETPHYHNVNDPTDAIIKVAVTWPVTQWADK